MIDLRKVVRCGAALATMALILLDWGLSDATASAITYEFGGVITSADPSSGIAPGTRFSGTFRYDPKDMAQSIEIEGDRNYLFGRVAGSPVATTSGIDGMSLSIGGQSIASMSRVLQVSLYQPEMGGYTDSNGAILHSTNLNISNAASALDGPLNISLALSNPNRTVYSTLDMPTTISLADFPSALLSVSSISPFKIGGPNTPNFTGTLDSITAIPAPEPSTLAVLGLAAAGWLWRSRRRQSL